MGATQHSLLTFRLDDMMDGKIYFDHPPFFASYLTDEDAEDVREGKSFALGHIASAVAELDRGLGLLTPWVSEWVSLALCVKPVSLPEFPHVESSLSSLPYKKLLPIP